MSDHFPPKDEVLNIDPASGLSSQKVGQEKKEQHTKQLRNDVSQQVHLPEQANDVINNYGYEVTEMFNLDACPENERPLLADQSQEEGQKLHEKHFDAGDQVQDGQKRQKVLGRNESITPKDKSSPQKKTVIVTQRPRRKYVKREDFDLSSDAHVGDDAPIPVLPESKAVTVAADLPEEKVDEGKCVTTLPVETIRMIRLPRLLEILGISRSSYYDWSNPKSPRYDATLPKKYSLGVKSVGWRLDEALSWVENKSAVEGR